MEPLQSVKRSVSRESLSHSLSVRSRAISDIGARRNIGSPRGDMEGSRDPLTLPQGFASMLKTTTETGDIGQFSIRPSRLPPPLNAPRRTGGTWEENGRLKQQQQPFRSYGDSNIIDDRRRLPSYARDASSEVSMYDTASQKSARSRVLEDHDYRSFSMTQASSYAPYTLHNHKSYSSLRSQAEGNVQRPRSPFAYPTRLKRPGFRPSSPALTDGGAIDYSRRAEIERNPLYIPNNLTSSPASLYARKRMPAPLSIRTDANRSTPPLFSQTSSPRRSTSPQRTITPGNEWRRGHMPESETASPARSTYSLASTVNLYAQVPSTTTTPGKVPASPLYYDYTEEFDIDDYQDSRPTEPPPTFRIEKTIPEDRPLSDSPSFGDYATPRLETNLDGRLGLTPSSESLFFSDNIEREWSRNPDHRSHEVAQYKSDQSQSEETLETPALDVDNKIDLSEPQKDASSPSEIVTRRSSAQNESFEVFSPSLADDPVNHDLDKPNGSSTKPVFPMRSSSYILSNPLPVFPNPPGHQFPQHETDPNEIQKGDIVDGLIPVVTEDSQICPPLMRTSSSTTQKGVAISYPRTPAEEGKSLGLGSESLQQMVETPRRTPMLSPTILEEPGCSQSDQSAMDFVSTPIQTYSRKCERRGEAATCPTDADKEYLNFSHQIPNRTVSRSDSPMLAPKPISPARQFKLKNSVPQLMKALPPLPASPQSPALPPDPPLRTASTPKNVQVARKKLPYQLPPVLPKPCLTRQQQQIPNPCEPAQEEQIKEPPPVELDSVPINAGLVEAATPPPPKLRLKMRTSSTLRATSPPDARPWNLDENYPWTNHQPNVRLPSLTTDNPRRGTKPPKFKLKITRASNSTQGTVRINRDSADSRPANQLELQNPKDLFTPTTSGLDNIFRKVSRNFKSRRSSITSIKSAEESILPIMSAPSENQRLVHSSSLKTKASLEPLRIAPASLSPNLSPTDVRSFFSDDSSQHRGSHSLRKRFSNLRARIPYTSRNASQSYDDILYRERRATEIHLASMSNTKLNVAKAGPEEEARVEKRVQARKFKTKVSQWLKGARSAIKARVKFS